MDTKAGFTLYLVCVVYYTRSQYTSQDGRLITSQDTVRDFGILMSCDGSFSVHINKGCTTAKNLCSWILQTFKAQQRKPKLTLRKSLVLPHLDYCCQRWSPDKTGDIQALEGIQRFYLRKISE